MIERLEGRVVRRGAGSVVLACGGWWLELQVPSSAPERIGGDDEAVALWTHLLWKEDGPTLCGFADPSERALFRQLLQVQGVGPRIALALLQRMTPSDLVRALRARSAELLTETPGIGAKLAARILVELGPRADRAELDPAETTMSPPVRDTGVDDAVRALMALGYPARESAAAVAQIRRSQPELPLDEILRAALLLLGRGISAPPM